MTANKKAMLALRAKVARSLTDASTLDRKHMVNGSADLLLRNVVLELKRAMNALDERIADES